MCLCALSHLFYDSVPDLELIPCCLVLTSLLACPAADDNVGFAYAGIKVALNSTLGKQLFCKYIYI